MTIRQNKKRKFWCAAELDAVCIEKYGFQKFLKKKYRGSAGVKTAEKNLAELRKVEERCTHDERITAAKNAITFLDLKASCCQAALDEAVKQFREDFPTESEEMVPKPKPNARLLKKEVQAVAAAIKQKFKEKLDKVKQTFKMNKKNKIRSKKPPNKKLKRCAKCGSTDHVRSSKKACPKYEPRQPQSKQMKKASTMMVRDMQLFRNCSADNLSTSQLF